MLKFILVQFINSYQRSLSPDHGLFLAKFPYGYCKFYPSCSEYTKLSIIRFGSMRGVWLGIFRIIRCNPWSEPKIDKVLSEL